MTYEEIAIKSREAGEAWDEVLDLFYSKLGSLNSEDVYKERLALYETEEYKECIKWESLEILNRPKEKISMEEPLEYDYRYTIKKFINDCIRGFIMNSDGIGYYGTESLQSDLPAIPSNLIRGLVRKDFTHIYWYNK